MPHPDRSTLDPRCAAAHVGASFGCDFYRRLSTLPSRSRIAGSTASGGSACRYWCETPSSDRCSPCETEEAIAAWSARMPSWASCIWRALDLLRAYVARDRAAVIEHLADLEDDQLEFAAGVLANTLERHSLGPAGRRASAQPGDRGAGGRRGRPLRAGRARVHRHRRRPSARPGRGEDAGSHRRPRPHPHHGRLQPRPPVAVFSRNGVQRSLDQTAQTTETIGRPRPYSVA